MMEIPELSKADLAFGRIDHMPRYADIPAQFKSHGGTPYNHIVSKWFFIGLGSDDLATLKEKPGVDCKKALAAVAAVLRSYEPKHEHKEAACAYMLSEWFDIQGAAAEQGEG